MADIEGDIQIEGNQALRGMSMPKLERVLGYLVVRDVPVLVEVLLTALAYAPNASHWGICQAHACRTVSGA